VDQAELAGLARLCGCLQLALSIVAAKLTERPHWTVQRISDRLTDDATSLRHTGNFLGPIPISNPDAFDGASSGLRIAIGPSGFSNEKQNFSAAEYVSSSRRCRSDPIPPVGR
jgi:hypothetical protein